MAELIDRQAAIKTVLTYLVEYCGATFDEDMQRTLKERLDSLPSAEPERKTGKWISVGERCGEPIWQCSECKVEEAVPTATSFITGISYAQWNYCPNCGVKMEEEE